MPKRTVTYQGKDVQAEEVEFETEHEGFNSYILGDGTRLKLKTVVLEIVRMDNEFNSAGEPIYLVKAQQAVTAIVPDSLKKR